MSDKQVDERLRLLEARIDMLEHIINHATQLGDTVIVEQNLNGISGRINEVKEYTITQIIKGV